MYRIVVLVLLVAGLMLVVGDLSAERPPIRDTGIPIYLGDPDAPAWCRRADRVRQENAEFVGGFKGIDRCETTKERWFGRIATELNGALEAPPYFLHIWWMILNKQVAWW